METSIKQTSYHTKKRIVAFIVLILVTIVLYLFLSFFEMSIKKDVAVPTTQSTLDILKNSSAPITISPKEQLAELEKLEKGTQKKQILEKDRLSDFEKIKNMQ